MARISNLNRRGFLKAAGAGAAFAVAPGIIGRAAELRLWRSDPFSLGVASGSPSPDGFVLWTRLAPEPTNYAAGEPGGMTGPGVPVTYEIATDAAMQNIVRRGSEIADPDFGYSVHAEISGLEPARPYWYRFISGSATSSIARAMTSPLDSAAPEALRFGFVSCANYQHGYYAAYRHLAEENPDAVFFLGDYIYESIDRNPLPSRRHSEGVEANTLPRYRSRYAQYKSDPDLQALHRNTTGIFTWDDHEVQNDYGDRWSEDRIDPAVFIAQRAAAYQAFYEHMPLRPSARPNGADMRVYDRYRFGDLAEFSVLDGRQYRSREACYEHDAHGHPENDTTCPERREENRSMLGLVQERWLFDGLAQSRARWNIIAQDVLMAQYSADERGIKDLHSTDSWDGYPAGRARLLQHIADSKVSNPVVLGGDIHSFWANDLKLDFDNPSSRAIATEFVGTSISSRPPPYELIAPFMARNPHVKFFESRMRGYAISELSRDRLTTRFRAVSDVTDAKARISTLKTFVVENGKAGPVEA